MTRTTIATACAALALGLGACGGGDSESDARSQKSEAGVKDTLRSYITAIKRGDAVKACELLTEQAKTASGTDCIQSVTRTSFSVPAEKFDAALSGLDGATVTINGDTATSSAYGEWPASNYRYQEGKWFLHRE